MGRSRVGYQGPLPGYSGKRFHTHLTLHFDTYIAAEEYSQVFRKAGIVDNENAEVIYSHKDRVDTRPPQIKRRGIAMAPLYNVIKKALHPGEKLDQVHEGKDDDKYGLFYAIQETSDVVRELVQAHWTDDGSTVRIVRFSNWAASVPVEVRTEAEKIVGL